MDKSNPNEINLSMEQLFADCLAGISVEAASSATSALFAFSKGSGFLPPTQQKKFHSLVAKIRYLAKNVRPDLNLVAAVLSTGVMKPKFDDKAKLQRALAYLNKTKEIYLKN